MGRPKLFSREKVLSKAMELFRKQGYYATSIDDLVQELGVNRASLYETFGGKREIFAEALEMYIEAAGLNLKNFLDQQKGAKEGLKQLFLNSLQAMKAGRVTVGCLALNTAIELLPLDKEVKPCLLGHQKRIQGNYVDFIRKGIASGEIAATKNPTAIAEFLFTFFSGLGVLVKLQADEAGLIPAIDEALKVLDGP